MFYAPIWKKKYDTTTATSTTTTTLCVFFKPALTSNFSFLLCKVAKEINFLKRESRIPTQ